MKQEETAKAKIASGKEDFIQVYFRKGKKLELCLNSPPLKTRVGVSVMNLTTWKASLVAQLVKKPPAMWETWVQSLGWEDPLEKGKLSTPVFWPGEFRGLKSIGSQRVEHD